VRDGQQCDRPRCHRLGGLGRRMQRVQLTAGGAVEHIPTARPQALTDVVGRLEVALAPALDALGQQLLGVVLR
jgi:hypothetical protein